MRTIINGSRWIRDEGLFWTYMNDIDIPISEVYCGTAAGPDTLGERWAWLHGYPVRYFKPDWESGKAAGMERNLDMLNDGAEAVISFWDGTSKGTTHLFIESRKRKLPTAVFTFDMLPINPLKPTEVNWALNNIHKNY